MSSIATSLGGGTIIKDTLSTADIVVHDVHIYTAEHPEIQAITKSIDEPSIHGDKVWDASFVLMDFLEQFPLDEPKNILEIGCGWGILTTYLARQYAAKVDGLDADDIVKHYFDFHAHKNNVELGFIHGTMNSMKKTNLSRYDVIVGSDICFWDSLKKDWQNLIRRALQSGVKEIYITDPGRPPFWDLVDYAEKYFGAEIWSHEVNKPYEIEQYVLEINHD